MKKLITIVLPVFLVCCGKTDKIVSGAGESLGKQVSNFSKSVGEGVDKDMLAKVTLDKSVQDIGLTHTTAKRMPVGAKKGVTVYFIASKDVDVTLRAIAKNSEDLEIGRSKLPVKLMKDDAAYFTFEFDRQMDSMMVKDYTIFTQ